MSKVNTAVEDNIFLRYLVIITGMLIACIGINGFIRPAHLLSGGVPGISTAINYLTGINIGILTFLINIPIFILGFIYLEKSFCISSTFMPEFLTFSDISEITPALISP